MIGITFLVGSSSPPEAVPSGAAGEIDVAKIQVQIKTLFGSQNLTSVLICITQRLRRVL